MGAANGSVLHPPKTGVDLTFLAAVVLAAACIPIITLWLNAEGILLLLRQEPEVARLAGVYLKWLTLGLPAYAFNAIARRYFQSQGNTNRTTSSRAAELTNSRFIHCPYKYHSVHCSD
jgi:Na+-driven multidrug efflux pump